MASITVLSIIVVILVLIIIALGVKIKGLKKPLTATEKDLVGTIKTSVQSLAESTINDLVSSSIVKFKATEKNKFVDELVDSVVFSLSSTVKDDVKELLSVTDFKELESTVKSIIESSFNLDDIFNKLKEAEPALEPIVEEGTKDVVNTLANDVAKEGTTDITKDLENITK